MHDDRCMKDELERNMSVQTSTANTHVRKKGQGSDTLSITLQFLNV